MVGWPAPSDDITQISFPETHYDIQSILKAPKLIRNTLEGRWSAPGTPQGGKELRTFATQHFGKLRDFEFIDRYWLARNYRYIPCTGHIANLYLVFDAPTASPACATTLDHDTGQG